MCLALPGRILSVGESDSVDRQGVVEFGGVCKEVCLGLVPGVNVGDYVIVHAGFAISQLDQDEAQQTLADFDALTKLNAE